MHACREEKVFRYLKKTKSKNLIYVDNHRLFDFCILDYCFIIARYENFDKIRAKLLFMASLDCVLFDELLYN